MPEIRSDLDIAEDITGIIRGYSPLRQSREFIQYGVQGGTVTVTGNINSRQAKRYFLDHLNKLDGVISLDSARFFADDELLLNVGQMLPAGVSANVSMGVVVLSGVLPSNVPLESFVEKIRTLTGITRVVSDVHMLAPSSAPQPQIQPQPQPDLAV